MRISRREMLGLTVLAGGAGAVALLAYRRRRRGAPHLEPPRGARRPDGVPLSGFDGSADAERVTEGIDLTGKTILVTGVTSGIGRETMRVLAMRGARVIGTGRTMDGARQACASVGGITVPLQLELTDYEGVVRCADRVRALGGSLDGLICNAGVMGLPRLEQIHGIEKHFATNHLGHFLLTNCLLETLVRTPGARILVVSSYVMSWSSPAGIEWDNLSGERLYHKDRAYGQSKLANALFALELARRLEGTHVTANSLEPGYVDTALFRNYPVSLNGFRGVLSSEKMTVGQGAATSCYLATAPAVAAVSGFHFANCNPVIPVERARDPAAAARLWRVSSDLLARYLPGPGTAAAAARSPAPLDSA